MSFLLCDGFTIFECSRILIRNAFGLRIESLFMPYFQGIPMKLSFSIGTGLINI